jgi:hypothetical protein
MKKQAKKLALAKETLRSLEQGGLSKVAGEASAQCTDTNCCSGLAGCGTTACTATQTAGTRLC